MARSHNTTSASGVVVRRCVMYVDLISEEHRLDLHFFDIVTFSLASPSNAVIVLSQLDSRYYRDVSGKASWTMDFVLVKQGDKEPLAESAHSDFYLRNVHLEIELEAGDYNVYVRLDRSLDKNDDDVCKFSLFMNNPKLIEFSGQKIR